jgi:hypothetical protein
MKLIMEKIDRQPNYDNNSAKANDIFARILVHFGNLHLPVAGLVTFEYEPSFCFSFRLVCY